jgi:long-chain acyl-CoA synthetase
VEIRDEKGNSLPQGVRGLVWVKGPQVMLGYFKNSEATNKVMTKDGWFNTGDLGMITFNNTLKLMGRAKDTIVLLGGENVEPVPIENVLTESQYIKDVMVVGQDQKSLGALIVPAKENLEVWLNAKGMDGSNFDKVLENKEVQELYASEIRIRVSSQNGFKSYERITAFKLIKKPFELNDEITATLKLKRHVITEKYKKDITQFYKK